MDMKRIAVVDVLDGDWLMVPPGQGKHRGASEDSGILVVKQVWTGSRGTLIDGYDMVDGWERFIDTDNTANGQCVMVEVIR